ncbi:hypothetical protein [Blastomonas sp. SL216]|uniref:hypothetical protein n=1 Tax=Blastomonas sp. SL216 TaxID=2995169 RepID=UPI002377390D|nr:hypothetical protein OU999_17230 [Blastomonas sp. SL216]
MAMPPIDLKNRQFAIHFETNQAIRVERLGAFLTALGMFADEHLGPDAEFELTHLSKGSVIAIFDAWGSVIGGLGGFGSFVLAVSMCIESNRQRRLSKRAAELVVDDGVVAITIDSATTGRIVIEGASTAAVQALLAVRQNEARLSARWYANRRELGGDAKYLPDSFDGGRISSENLVTQDGRSIVTESGLPILPEAVYSDGPNSLEYSEFIQAVNRNPKSYSDDPRNFGVFVGRIELVNSRRYLVTQSGRRFRLVGVSDIAYSPHQIYVVRGPVVEDVVGGHHWLEAKDLFIATE